MTLRVCLNRLVFLLFSLARELSPFRLHEHVLSLLVSKLFIIFCGILTDFNSLPPDSLVLLHFNCDFHAYLTRSRSTCIKCPSGINWLLVLKPRLFGYNFTLAFFCSQWQISIFDYSSYFRSLHHSSNRRGTAFLQKS